jgi:hypothetical protein
MEKRLGYVLSRDGLPSSADGQGKRYHRQELELMTVYQLREIAKRERIIHGIVNPLDKDLLVDTILRYRGAESALLIREYRAEDYEILEETFHHMVFQERKDVKLDCSARITVYQGLAVDYYDEITISYRPEFRETNAFLVDSEKNLCAVFSVESKGSDRSRLYLRKGAAFPCHEASVKRYTLLFLERYYSEQIFRFYNGEITYVPSNIPAVFEELLDFTVKEPDVLKMPAAIDFGTSNTVAGILDLGSTRQGQTGIYHEKVQYAIFYDPRKDYQPTHLVPSLIGVLSLEDAAHPRYCFGYEAQNMALFGYVEEGFCLFYDIKRWIADYEKEEELLDKYGRRAFVKRKDILREYFLYIIHSLENRIKHRVHYVHLSCPVKQKHKFQRLFQEVLPEYAIERRDMIDEGVSVLYNTISEMIETGKVPKNQKVSALIIDCGGGTMDISSCVFQVEDRRVAYKIDIETSYENGSTDFGGNNLTYRIFQLLKLRIVEILYRQYMEQTGQSNWEARQNFYGKKPSFDEWDREVASAIPSRQRLLADFDREVFRYVDENGTESIYRNFEKAYAQAEEILPTRFKDWETRTRNEYFQVRNNFYFLFQCAEQIKKEFFENTFILRVLLSAEGNHAQKDWETFCKYARNFDNTIVLPMDKWKIAIRNSEGLSVLHDLPDLSFSVFAINLLLAPDIYSAVHRFMDPLYESGELDEYSIIKLSGQSCKIDLFRTSLKEFVPGKVIKSRRETKQEDGVQQTDSSELKMSCIDGVLKYLRDKKFGYADVTIRNREPHLPYILTGFTHTGKEIPMIHGAKGIRHGVISRNMDDLTLTLYLKDDREILRHEFVYYCTLEEFEPKRQEEIEELYGENIPQDDTDNIVDREVKFFVWADPMEWGFLVAPIYRDVETLRMGREQFFSFEDDQWARNFFDGMK